MQQRWMGKNWEVAKKSNFRMHLNRGKYDY